MHAIPRPESVVVIEDIPTIAKLVTIVLNKAGIEVVPFAGGREALAWLTDNRPGAVVCDIMLPDITGEDVLAGIRALPDGDTLPVLAVTAIALEGDRERLLAAGFDDYIAKPINTLTFADQVRRHLRPSV